jgi:hypothetical protein
MTLDYFIGSIVLPINFLPRVNVTRGKIE